MSIADCEREESGWGVLEGLPGDPMMWVLVFSELVAFGLFLGAFIVARAVRPAIFASGQTALDLTLAGCNTIVLVTSGWAAAKGAASARADEARRARLWLLLAMALGGAFVTIKLVEYAREIGGGIGLETSVFFTLYFLLTGFTCCTSASESSFSPSSATAPIPCMWRPGRCSGTKSALQHNHLFRQFGGSVSEISCASLASA